MSAWKIGPMKRRLSRSPLGRLLNRSKAKIDPNQQPFVAHLVELRDRLLRIVIVVGVLFLALSPFANGLYEALAKPLMQNLPVGAGMISIDPAAPFITPFKFTLVFSIFLLMPYALYQIWAFVAPGLYDNERRMIIPLLVSSSALFYAGVLFAYFVVFPLVFGFLTQSAPEGVSVMTDISRYLDFVIKLFFAFGLAFEVPVATVLVIWAGMTTAESLAAKRAYIIVGAFVFGMLLTPPDAISQILLAVPMWLLFEAGLVASRWVKPKDDDEASDPETDR